MARDELAGYLDELLDVVESEARSNGSLSMEEQE